MPATSLREIVLGVADLADRATFYRRTLGLEAKSRGRVDAATAAALWGKVGPKPVYATVLHRPDVAGSPRLRLVGTQGPRSRPGADFEAPGPLGLGFTTAGVQGVHGRLTEEGIRFVSPPLELTPGGTGPAGPRRFEAFGRGPDGEALVLIERLNAPTPYGTIPEPLRVSEPLHTSHSVPDLPAARRFLVELLDHEVLLGDTCRGPVFDALLGLRRPGTSFRFEMLHRPGFPTGRIVLMEFATGRQPAREARPLGRGLTALRYDCDDLVARLRRVEAAGGVLLRGPAHVDSKVLGTGRAAVVRSPFGTLFELWQTI
jgi:catechol 2,3-dioxygenase-like lactoylglutathione lyase family enzyme